VWNRIVCNTNWFQTLPHCCLSDIHLVNLVTYCECVWGFDIILGILKGDNIYITASWHNRINVILLVLFLLWCDLSDSHAYPYYLVFTVSWLSVSTELRLSAAGVTGYLSVFCQILLNELDRLPGDSRMQIGFITFDSFLYFYGLDPSFPQPKMFIISDLDGTYFYNDASLFFWFLSECL